MNLPEHYSLAQLAGLVGRSIQTLRLHIRHGWLAAEKRPGARGWRVAGGAARQWASAYMAVHLGGEGRPGPPPAPPPPSSQPTMEPPGETPAAALAVQWCRSLHHEHAHLIQPSGKALCNAAVPLGGAWIPVPADELDMVRRCKRCMHHAP